MNLHRLRVFLAVVEHGGVSRAAQALCLTQSAVSKALKQLEHQLGLPLLERSPLDGKSLRGVQLTGHGEALHQHARVIFALEQAASDDMADRAQIKAGALRLGASTTIGGYWLPRWVARYKTLHPAIDVELRIGNTCDIAQALLDYRLDIGWVEGQVSETGIQAVPWREEPLVLVCGSQHPLAGTATVTAAMLTSCLWLTREAGSGTGQMIEAWLAQQSLLPERQLRMGSNEAIAQAVAAGDGVSLLPRVVVADLLQLQRVHVVAWPSSSASSLQRSLYQLTLAHRPPSPALRAFLALLDSVAL
ncbi:hypothetical protein ABB29_05975 [Pseudoxanthomonas dokdonensis]|uniref:HTH lysR-type domain-containing protein n=2 Tax=Pseudoxanthomonas dokdonensis TaxID=344882 RepID=A0A0R0CKQ7_9GAMM|nr:hypothetical protein ABB29_05975 [Pseudoxanthomonas dokdonensis]